MPSGKDLGKYEKSFFQPINNQFSFWSTKPTKHQTKATVKRLKTKRKK